MFTDREARLERAENYLSDADRKAVEQYLYGDQTDEEFAELEKLTRSERQRVRCERLKLSAAALAFIRLYENS
jgi:hypothetical protein